MCVCPLLTVEGVIFRERRNYCAFIDEPKAEVKAAGKINPIKYSKRRAR
jgi:hypothetical protein